MDALGYSFGSRVKLVRLTPEPKPLSFGIATGKGKLSPATRSSASVRDKRSPPSVNLLL